MAISIDIKTSQYGIPFAGAYFRIATAAISRRRAENIKFGVMIDVAGYGISNPGNDTQEIDFRRYNAALEEIEAQSGNSFLEKCYAWVMAQPDMAGAKAV